MGCGWGCECHFEVPCGCGCGNLPKCYLVVSPHGSALSLPMACQLPVPSQSKSQASGSALQTPSPESKKSTCALRFVHVKSLPVTANTAKVRCHHSRYRMGLGGCTRKNVSSLAPLKPAAGHTSALKARRAAATWPWRSTMREHQRTSRKVLLTHEACSLLFATCTACLCPCFGGAPRCRWCKP